MQIHRYKLLSAQTVQQNENVTHHKYKDFATQCSHCQIMLLLVVLFESYSVYS